MLPKQLNRRRLVFQNCQALSGKARLQQVAALELVIANPEASSTEIHSTPRRLSRDSGTLESSLNYAQRAHPMKGEGRLELGRTGHALSIAHGLLARLDLAWSQHVSALPH